MTSRLLQNSEVLYKNKLKMNNKIDKILKNLPIIFKIKVGKLDMMAFK
jgi:hypothetical protein